MKDFFQYRELLEASKSWKSEPPETTSKVERVWQYSDFEDFDTTFEKMITLFDPDDYDGDFDTGQDGYYQAKNYMREWCLTETRHLSQVDRS